MYRFSIVFLATLTLTACGKSVMFKDGKLANEQTYQEDVLACSREALPLYPETLVDKTKFIQMPVQHYHDDRDQFGRLKESVVYETHLVNQAMDVNEEKRQEYLARCLSEKGYISR